MAQPTRPTRGQQLNVCCPRCQTPRFLDQRKLICPACTRFTQRARYVYILAGKAVTR